MGSWKDCRQAFKHKTFGKVRFSKEFLLLLEDKLLKIEKYDYNIFTQRNFEKTSVVTVRQLKDNFKKNLEKITKES